MGLGDQTSALTQVLALVHRAVSRCGHQSLRSDPLRIRHGSPTETPVAGRRGM